MTAQRAEARIPVGEGGPGFGDAAAAPSRPGPASKPRLHDESPRYSLQSHGCVRSAASLERAFFSQIRGPGPRASTLSPRPRTPQEIADHLVALGGLHPFEHLVATVLILR